MSEPSIINTPAACIKCGFITDSPTTGKTHDRCPCCGGKLITISQLTPGENVIVLAKRASWECSNDDGEWYGRKTTEEQIIKHFAPLGVELAALRAKLEEKERDAKRMASDNLELCDKLEEVAKSYGTLQDNYEILRALHRQQSEELARANRLLERAAGELELSTEIYPRAGLPNTAPLIARLAADLRAHLAAIDQARREGA